jgi:hypothetical protein
MKEILTVSKEEFINRVSIEKIVFESFNENISKNNFNILSIASIDYGFIVNSDAVWFSSEIHLKLIERSNIILLGIHDKIICFSSENGRIVFMNGLHDPISKIHLIKYGIVIITETTVLRINDQNNFTVSDFIVFDDIIVNQKFDNEHLIINSLNGSQYKVKL